jgi:hypothetical protein
LNSFFIDVSWVIVGILLTTKSIQDGYAIFYRSLDTNFCNSAVFGLLKSSSADRSPHLALVHEHQHIGQLAGKGHLVRDQHHGHAATGQVFHDLQHFGGQLRIQCRGHFVEQHQFRCHGQRARNRHALRLAARELLGVGFLLVLQTHQLQYLVGDLLRLFGRHLLDGRQRQRDVALHRQVREQVVALEDDADLLAQFAQVQLVRMMNIMSAYMDVAAIDFLQAVQATQQRALARTALADDGHHLALLHIQRDTVQYLVAAEALVQIIDLNDG